VVKPAERAQETRPRRMRGPERREQLLDIAGKVVEQEGLAALTMERVAAAAQVSKPVLYAHFENRAALLLALLERYWRDVDEAVAARLKESTTLDDRLTGLVEGVFDAIERGGPVVQLLLYNDSHEPLVEEARNRRYREAERTWSKAYQDRIGLSKAEADAAAAILRSALNGATAYWLRTKSASRALCMETFLTIARAGLDALAHSKRGDGRARGGRGSLVRTGSGARGDS
jgi:AcrR family transcriptional regulator